LYYRRLEKGTFQWPNEKTLSPQCISPRQLNWLLDGLPLEQKQAHQKVLAQIII